MAHCTFRQVLWLCWLKSEPPGTYPNSVGAKKKALEQKKSPTITRENYTSRTNLTVFLFCNSKKLLVNLHPCMQLPHLADWRALRPGSALVRSKVQRPDRWKMWIDSADKSERSWCVEMVLHYSLKAFANDVANEESSPICPKFALGQLHDWGVQPLRMEYLAGLSVSVIVRYPDFWQTIIDAGSKHAEGIAETTLLPLFTALRNLTLKVNDESLTAQDSRHAERWNFRHGGKTQAFWLAC